MPGANQIHLRRELGDGMAIIQGWLGKAAGGGDSRCFRSKETFHHAPRH